MGPDLFWASKIVGILAYLFMVFFAWKKNFYFREMVVIGALVSFMSVFSFTMSEAFLLPFMFCFLYAGHEIIKGEKKGRKAMLSLALLVIAMYNIRYSSLFIMLGCISFGLLFWKKQYSKYFIIAGGLGVAFMGLYQLTFIRYFNAGYISQFLETGLNTTPELLLELFQGLCTAFNPFIHIANPSGGVINVGIYGIGFLNIIVLAYLFLRSSLSETEKFFLITGACGIICSYFIQYFYSVNPIDYRLLAPFSFPIWMVYFKKLFKIIPAAPYGIAVLCLATGLVFTWLSRGNYLENRRKMTSFLQSEKLLNTPLKFYMTAEEDLPSMQLAELISTINPVIYVTMKPADSVQKNTLTRFKIQQKLKLDENKYQ